MDDGNKDLIDEIQKQAESRMQSLQQIAIAADTRAMQFGSACVAVSAVILTIMSQAKVGLPGYVCAVIFLIAAAMSFWTAKPANWYSPGEPPQSFQSDLEKGRSLHEVKMDMLSNYSEYITYNEAHLLKNGKIFRVAKIVALAAPMLSLIVYAAPSACKIVLGAN